jgi:hypothetical protein
MRPRRARRKNPSIDMATQLTADHFKQSLNAHVASKGEEIREKYGPEIGWKELQHVLNDRAAVRYPSEIVFDSSPLLEGEFAHAMPNSDNPNDGFKIYLHPYFSLQLERVPHLVFYQLVRVNYLAPAPSAWARRNTTRSSAKWLMNSAGNRSESR